jgi:hypothetical protein
MSTRPTTPSSPKTVKVKAPVPGMPLYGCEHVQQLFSQGQDTINTSIFHYKIILRKIFDQPPIVPQTSKSADGQPITNLTPNYLCLQCPTTLVQEDIGKHGSKKSHRFCMWDGGPRIEIGRTARTRLTHTHKTLNHDAAPCTATCATTLSTTRH